MKFLKVSQEQFMKDVKTDMCYYRDLRGISQESLQIKGYTEERVLGWYQNLKCPERATKYSAGYDIYAPYDISLTPGSTVKVSTGIRVQLDPDKFLMCCPRSGLGFKARLQLDNTVGIIDSDYFNADNEGHIAIKLTNDSGRSKDTPIFIKQGEAMCQAIILPYYLVEDDNIEDKETRTGGFGSTSK